MTKHFPAVAAVALLAACAVFGENPTPLNGLWGGNYAEITATSSSLVLNHGCYLVTFPGPVTLARGDSFSVNGKVTASSLTGQIGASWRMTGAVVGDTLSISASFLQKGSTDDWSRSIDVTLLRGHHGTFPTDLQCLQ